MPGGKRAKWLWLVLLYVLILEGLSWWPSPASGPCLINPQEHAQTGKNDNQQACTTFFRGSLILLGRADHFIESHDKSIVAVFTVVLAISTILLWRSTDKLWLAGERQMGLIARNTFQQREIGEAQVRAYVSIKSAKIYFGADDAMPFIEIVAANSGQSPALAFIWSPRVNYLADVKAEIAYDPGEEWMAQPGSDIAPASETKAVYFPVDFSLVDKVTEHREMPDRLGISVTIDFAFVDVFGNQISDMASFAGVAEPGDAKRNTKAIHPLNTSAWACHLYPIEKGKLWSGVAIKAPPFAEQTKENDGGEKPQTPEFGEREA